MTNFVFLPGGSLDPWIWDDVAAKVNGIVLSVPGREPGADRAAMRLDDMVDELQTQIEAIKAPVLVAHSASGILATNLAQRIPQHLKHIVFVGSVVPKPGVSFIGSMPAPAKWVLRVIAAMSPKGMLPPAGMVRKELCNDVSEELTERIVDTLQREVRAYYTGPCAGESPVPSTYIRLLKDKAVPIHMQDEVIARLGCTVVDLDTGHMPMVVDPDGMVAILKAVQ